MNKDISTRIREFNTNRLPEMLPYKYKAMRESSFRFYRGTAHLFFEDFPHKDKALDTPLTWLSGDLHLENFGTYRGDNRLIYFDINDFDEGLLGPASLDICRLLTSIHLVCQSLNYGDGEAEKLCALFLTQYCNHLKTGHAFVIENATSKGIIKRFLKNLKERDLKDIIKKETHKVKGKRLFIADNERIYDTAEPYKEKVRQIIEQWDLKNSKPEMHEVIDSALRIMGTGSIGVERYIALIDLKEGGKRKRLLDIKRQFTPSALPYVKAKQPEWIGEAHRVKEIQSRMQFTSIALLEHVEYGDTSYTIRELQLPQDKMNIDLVELKKGEFELLITEMAKVTASAQIRSSGRQGSAITDELIAFGSRLDWQEIALDFSKTYFAQVQRDYADFCLAYDEGGFK